MEFESFNDNSKTEHREKPNNYLALSIISTVLGFCSCIGLITGVVAIVMSVTSGTKYKNGEYDEAVKYAKYAKIISLITIAIFVLSVIYSWFTIQQMGGWDAYMNAINEAMNQAQ